MNNLLRFVTPNAATSRQDRIFISVGWLILTFLVWQFTEIRLLPKPADVLDAFGTLERQHIFDEIWTSFKLMMEAILWTIAISLTMAYSSVIALVEPAIKFATGLRSLGLVGLMLVFTLLASSGHDLKVMLLTFGMTVFYLRDMLGIVQGIPQEQYDHAKTLGLSPLRIVYEVVILGTLDQALESLRVNAAMGWMMLTVVEGVSRSEGGIGIVLLNMNKHMDLAAVGAIMICLFSIGILQDRVLGWFKDYFACPYVRMSH